MASGGRLRKVAVVGALIIAGLGLTAFIFRDQLSLEYHKRRLIAAKARHWRLTTQGYSFWDHVAEIARGRPVSADEVITTWKRHEEALVRRGFLKREVFIARNGLLPSRSSDRPYNDALAQMEGACRFWSVTRAETNLVVTATPKCLALWKGLALQIGLIPIEDSSQTAQQPKKRCSRKRKKSRETETFAVSLASGYIADDDFMRAFVRQHGSVAGGLQR